MKRIQDQQNETDVKNAMDTLMWLRYAKGNMRTVELLHAIAFRSDMAGSIESRLPLEDDILSACAGLVVIVEPEVWR